MFSMTPHPHEDPDGTTYNVAVSLKHGTRFNILRIPSEPCSQRDKDVHPLHGTEVLSSFVPKNRLAYYHSFAMTPNYFVFVENPFVVNLWALLTMKIKGKLFILLTCLRVSSLFFFSYEKKGNLSMDSWYVVEHG